jgi:hypothetical protein
MATEFDAPNESFGCIQMMNIPIFHRAKKTLKYSVAGQLGSHRNRVGDGRHISRLGGLVQFCRSVSKFNFDKFGGI